MLEGLTCQTASLSYSVDGNTYIVTANEGDGREYGIKTTQKSVTIKALSGMAMIRQRHRKTTIFTEKDFVSPKERSAAKS
ncbi:hypothetical protein OH492_15370 [Vibrio chagasii]|nr:hypothetical protein [Vibrio chagasii]